MSVELLEITHEEEKYVNVKNHNGLGLEASGESRGRGGR